MRPIISLACGLALLAALSCVAAADPPPANPTSDAAATGSIPQLGIGRAADAENVEIQYALEKLFFEPAPAPPGGAPRVERRIARTEARATVEQRVRLVAIGQLVAQRPDGSAVSKDDLVKVLAKPTPVLLGKTGQKIDPLFLGMLKPDALVLMLPEQQHAVTPPNPNQLGQPPRPANPAPLRQRHRFQPFRESLAREAFW